VAGRISSYYNIFTYPIPGLQQPRHDVEVLLSAYPEDGSVLNREHGCSRWGWG